MKIVTTEGKAIPNFEYILGTDTEAYALGEILTLASGRLTKAGLDSDGTQLFICMKGQAAETTAVTPIPVVRLRPEIVLEAVSSGQLAATTVGTLVTLDAAATGVTATATKGVFTIRSTDGATKSKVTGSFE